MHALTYCVLFYSVCDLKTSQMNVQRSRIREIMHYKFELGRNSAEVTKNICCEKGEGAVDPSTVNRWLKNFRSD